MEELNYKELSRVAKHRMAMRRRHRTMLLLSLLMLLSFAYISSSAKADWEYCQQPDGTWGVCDVPPGC